MIINEEGTSSCHSLFGVSWFLLTKGIITPSKCRRTRRDCGSDAPQQKGFRGMIVNKPRPQWNGVTLILIPRDLMIRRSTLIQLMRRITMIRPMSRKLRCLVNECQPANFCNCCNFVRFEQVSFVRCMNETESFRSSFGLYTGRIISCRDLVSRLNAPSHWQFD